MAVDSGPGNGGEAESDLRRRAAWLLGMLAIVAVLVIVVMSQLVGSGNGKNTGSGPGVDDSAVGAHTSSSSHVSSAPPSSSSRAVTTSAAPTTGGLGSAVHGTSCPGKQVCALDGDPGNGIAAINDYRTQHGKDAVVGRVSAQAQRCALNNGSGCSGGWAETELPKADGPAAVQKILPFAHLLEDMKSFAVGWAYDPSAKMYYFAIVRKV